MGKAPTPSHYLKIGLITIPVKSYAAARNGTAELVNVHKACATEGKDATLGILKKCKGCEKKPPTVLPDGTISDWCEPCYKDTTGKKLNCKN